MLIAAFAVCLSPSALHAPVQAPQPERIVLSRALAIGGIARGGRLPVPTDAVLAAMAGGAWRTPSEGDTLPRPNGGEATWKAIAAKEDGWFEDASLRGGYAVAVIDVSAPRVAMLEAAGHSLAYVNGEPRGGDPYGFGYLRVPVALKAGANELVFSVGRGRLRAALAEPPAPASIDTADPTLPDFVAGERRPVLAGIVVVNARPEPLVGAQIVARAGGAAAVSPVPSIPPMAVRKVPVTFAPPANPQGPTVTVDLELAATEGRSRMSLHKASVSVRVRSPKQGHRRTFLSTIDGSVQYYAVNPAQTPSPANALVLTLHGASVEAQGQADAYKSKDWVTLVAPTNRRPYGFDWEDWGRWDAMEVLAEAERTLAHDPLRVHVTGHSMGGHGTWHLGLTFPDRFGTVAPSAGWSSFFSYGGTPRWTNPSKAEALLNRAVSPSDTLVIKRNSLLSDVYVLHGDKDDNVPVTEARLMREALEQIGHPNLHYHEQPGAGHWWGGECVDWPPLFDVIKASRRPRVEHVRAFSFETANPAVSSRCYWLNVEQQERALEPSRATVEIVGGSARELVVTTANVAWFSVDRSIAPFSAAVVDGQRIDRVTLAAVGPRRVHFAKRNGLWFIRASLDPAWKHGTRSGPFKEAFKNRMLFVVGTRGTPEQNAWAAAKARFDAETFQYRGNGAVDIVADHAFDPKATRGRNVILFGGSDVNGAWKQVLEGCPIDVRADVVTVGARRVEGDDLAVLFAYPRSGDPKSLVGVVAATGRAGATMVDRLPTFVSGVAYPDWIVVGADGASKGNAGIRAAGFFGNDWRIASGDSAWQ